MGTKDLASKKLEDYNDVFADILNTLLFKKKFIDERYLRDTSTESIYKTDEEPLNEQRRDTLKNYFSNSDNAEFLVAAFGMENQTSFEKMMPFRVMKYDVGTYSDQLKNGNEIRPVITIVLNFSDRRWSKYKTLHELFGKMQPEIKAVVPDYKINVFDIAFLEDVVIDSFTSDFRAVARFFKNKRIGKDAFADKKVLEHVTEVLEMLKVFAKDKDYENISDYVLECQKREGDVTMCTVAQALKQEGRRDGIVEGRREGWRDGRREGWRDGRREGKRDGIIESLCRMINGGLSESFIIGLGYTKDEYDSALKITKNLSA